MMAISAMADKTRRPIAVSLILITCAVSIDFVLSDG
jgi:hypothetical protein